MSKEFEFVFRRPERTVVVPAFNVSMSGERKFIFDTEHCVPGLCDQYFFSRPVGLWMHDSKEVKTFTETNMLMACQTARPLEFSLFDICADFDRSDEDLCEGVLEFRHGSSDLCFTSEIGSLCSTITSLGHIFPEWFIHESRCELEKIYDRASAGKDAFHALSEKWRPRQQYRHIQPGEAITACVKFPRPLKRHCDIKIALDGIEWRPE